MYARIRCNVCDVCPDSIRSDGRCDVIYVRNARYGILAPVGVTKLWGRTLDLILHLQSLPIFEVNPNAWGQCGPGFAYCGSGFAQCGFGFVGWRIAVLYSRTVALDSWNGFAGFVDSHIVSLGSRNVALDSWIVGLDSWIRALWPWIRVVRFQSQWVQLGTWSLELGAWNLELGAWSLELGTWSLELGAGRQLNRDNFWLVRSFDNSRQEKVKNWKR